MAPNRYFATFKGQKEPTEIDVERSDDGRIVLTVHGKRHLVDALTLDHGAVSMIIDGESYAVEFDEADDKVAVLLRGHHFELDLVDERKKRLRAAGAGFAAEGKQQILAPMPGKVVKVLVTMGQTVTEGQPLVVVEAMKMENELKSPKAGKVVELLAKEGSAVEMNAKLVTVE